MLCIPTYCAIGLLQLHAVGTKSRPSEELTSTEALQVFILIWRPCCYGLLKLITASSVSMSAPFKNVSKLPLKNLSLSLFDNSFWIQEDCWFLSFIVSVTSIRLLTPSRLQIFKFPVFASFQASVMDFVPMTVF